MVFLHGAGGSSAIWFPQIRAFRQSYNLLLVDLRGHGKSRNLPPLRQFKNYSFSLIGDEVIEVLDEVGVESAHFVGISLGTILIRDLAERYPERIQSMVMGGAVMRINTRGQLLMRLGNLLKNLVPYLMLYRLFAFVIMPRKSNKYARSIFVNEAKKLYQKEFQRWFGLVTQVNPLLRIFRMRASEVPAIYLMGEADYMFLPAISKLAEEHSNAYLQVIPNSGHVVNIEQPVLFNSYALQFLSQHSGKK